MQGQEVTRSNYQLLPIPLPALEEGSGAEQQETPGQAQQDRARLLTPKDRNQAAAQQEAQGPQVQQPRVQRNQLNRTPLQQTAQQQRHSRRALGARQSRGVVHIVGVMRLSEGIVQPLVADLQLAQEISVGQQHEHQDISQALAAGGEAGAAEGEHESGGDEQT